MYKLYMPNYNENDNRELTIIRKLFKEVLGYIDKEIDYFEKTHYCCDVVINLTLEQAQEICTIFYSNEISLYLRCQATNKSLYWQKDLGIVIPKEPPKSHYCDTPLVSRDHLVDAFTEQERERQENIRQAQQESRNNATAKTNNTQFNTPKCPICQSTNLSQITTAQKAGKIALFGIFGMGDNGKTWKCNNCGSKF